jgi:hypothetical protein
MTGLGSEIEIVISKGYKYFIREFIVNFSSALVANKEIKKVKISVH